MRLLLISPKTVYATKRLVEETHARNFALTVLDIQDLKACGYHIDSAKFDSLYIRQAYLNTDRKSSSLELAELVSLARQFVQAGKIVVDVAIATGSLGQGKYEQLQQLKEAKISVPRTQPFSGGTKLPNFSFIAKWNYGFGARHTYLIKTPADLAKVQQFYPAKEILLQQFIEAEYEYKVITVGYQSLPVLVKVKTNPNKFLPDLKQYAVVPAATLPVVVNLAEQAAQITQRELAKVDILEVAGQFYILEVNRWPGLQYFERTSGYNVAGTFLDYIKDKVAQTCKI